MSLEIQETGKNRGTVYLGKAYGGAGSVYLGAAQPGQGGGGSEDLSNAVGVRFYSGNTTSTTGLHPYQGERLYKAADLSFSPSTDTTAGTDTFKNHPVYQGYYALVKKNATSGKAEIIAYEGTPEYDSIRAAGTEDYDEVRMFPKFYYKNTIVTDTTSNTQTHEILLSSTPKTGFKVSPMHRRYNSVSGQFEEFNEIGITRYAWGYDSAATSSMAARKGLYPLTSTTVATFHDKARARGMYVFGPREYSAFQMLGCVKYASNNWQQTVAAGYTNANVNVTLTADTTGTQTATFAYSEENEKLFCVGRRVSFADDRRYSNCHQITDVSIDGTTSITITFDGAAAPSITAGTTKLYLGLANNGTADNVKGLDGRNTAMSNQNDRMSANFLGIENAFGNVNKACAGVARYDGSLWVKDDYDASYTWLTTSSQTGWTRAADVNNEGEGYISKFAPTANMGDYDWLMSPVARGGSSGGYIGDYLYSNTTTSSVYMEFWGGNLGDGAFDGPFYSYLRSGVTAAGWTLGALGVFIPGK